MEPPITGHDAVSHNEPSVHNWRVSQLKRLGILGSLAARMASIQDACDHQLIDIHFGRR
jgi:hypothetical protein